MLDVLTHHPPKADPHRGTDSAFRDPPARGTWVGAPYP